MPGQHIGPPDFRMYGMPGSEQYIDPKTWTNGNPIGTEILKHRHQNIKRNPETITDYYIILYLYALAGFAYLNPL